MNVIPNEVMSFPVMQCHSERSRGFSRPLDYARGDIFLCHTEDIIKPYKKIVFIKYCKFIYIIFFKIQLNYCDFFSIFFRSNNGIQNVICQIVDVSDSDEFMLLFSEHTGSCSS